MSLTIENESFVIFGSGHDYTRLDSGNGENAMIFSHPFVPLGSKLYAGQFLFYVPDENGNAIDAVKDDLAHCTFTPSIGSTFDTEGETTVKVDYYREYIHDESTVVVEKSVQQKITVVDHGSVVRGADEYWSVYYCSDIYSDGYCFLHPRYVNNLTGVATCQPWNDSRIKKVSSIFWRTESLGGQSYFLQSSGLLDIDELRYADVSNVKRIRGLISGNTGADIDLSPLSTWDTSSVTDMSEMFTLNSKITSLKGLETWNVSNVRNLSSAFYNMSALADISALGRWNVSNVTTMASMFEGDNKITSTESLANWRPQNVTSMASMFKGCSRLASLHGVESWDVSSLKDIRTFVNGTAISSLLPLRTWNPSLTAISSAFASLRITSLEGLENFDVSGVSNFSGTFSSNGKLLTADGVETWNTSGATSFSSMFSGDTWLEDISALSNWDTSNVTSMDSMFAQQASILNIEPLDGWDFSKASMSNMFQGFAKYYSTTLGKDLWANAYYYFDYNGTEYVSAEVLPTTEYVKDASSAQNWNVNGTGKGAFDVHWSNVPSWN